MREARGLLDAGTGPDGIAYIIGGTAGNPHGRDTLTPPPSFLHEWTRSIVYAPSLDDSSDVIIVHDRVHMQNPMRLPRFDSYHPRDRKKMERELARGLMQWIIHMPRQPSVNGHVVSWLTELNQPVRVATLLPKGVVHHVLDEHRDVPMPKHVGSRERRWQVRVVPAEAREWETFLHVIHAGAGSVSAELVREEGWEGVRLMRPGHPDRLILFDNVPGPKLGSMNVLLGGWVPNPKLLKRLKDHARVQIR
jgi:hypothetical protein